MSGEWPFGWRNHNLAKPFALHGHAIGKLRVFVFALPESAPEGFDAEGKRRGLPLRPRPIDPPEVCARSLTSQREKKSPALLVLSFPTCRDWRLVGGENAGRIIGSPQVGAIPFGEAYPSAEAMEHRSADRLRACPQPENQVP